MSWSNKLVDPNEKIKKVIPEQQIMKPPRPIDVLYSLIKKIHNFTLIFLLLS